MTRPIPEPLHPSARELPVPEGLASYPPVERWDDWEEYDPVAWPRKVKRRYRLIPTICFNCEAACGLLAYVDKTTGRIQKFEGNPVHPGSRGRNCAKGPATLNQIDDPERIRYPMRRTGKRGGGQWERVSWDEALDDIAGRIRKALVEGRPQEVMYHLGRPGHELIYLQRVFHAWGIDGHNSHTNVCSASARAGYAFWLGMDRPSPDHANARFLLLLSSHLETGHYFNPHAQRIMEAKMRGARVCVLDTRLSNTASMADWWMSPWPGSEAAVLLAIARILVVERRYHRDFVRRWVNWEEYLREERRDLPPTFEAFERALDAARVSARLRRDELPAPALPPRGPGQARDVLHAGLQPRVDQSRRHVVGRDADRREPGRAPCVSHAGVERDGVVRRLRAANGPRVRASRPDVAGDARRALDRLPPAGAAGGDGARGADVRVDVAGPRGGRHRPGVGGRRVLDRALVAHRTRRPHGHP